MGTHTTHEYSPVGNIPLSFAPLLFSDPSYVDASRSLNTGGQGDGVRFIAKLARIFRARG